MFQRNSESALKESQVNASQPYKCKAVSSLAAYAAWTNQLVLIEAFLMEVVVLSQFWRKNIRQLNKISWSYTEAVPADDVGRICCVRLRDMLVSRVCLQKQFPYFSKWNAELNDSMTHSRFTCFITGWISVFERISWMNDSKTNTFLIAHFHQLKKKKMHTGIDRWNWNLNFATSIRFLTLSIRFWNWNWFSIPNPSYYNNLWNTEPVSLLRKIGYHKCGHGQR